MKRKSRPLNWHIQVYAAISVYQQLVTTIAGLKVPVVIDHYGQPNAAEGLLEGYGRAGRPRARAQGLCEIVRAVSDFQSGARLQGRQSESLRR
jgi:hypothetical protein